MGAWLPELRPGGQLPGPFDSPPAAGIGEAQVAVNVPLGQLAADVSTSASVWLGASMYIAAASFLPPLPSGWYTRDSG
jgi:hypothetical protein